MPPELEDAPEMPELLGYLWAIFKELSRTRSHNGFNFMPLQFVEIDAWRRLTKRKLDPWEVSAILRLDALYIQSLGKKVNPNGN